LAILLQLRGLFQSGKFEMKWIVIILHYPLVSLLVAGAVLFLLSLIATYLQDQRLNHELLKARLRAVTLYQRRRLKNELRKGAALSPAANYIIRPVAILSGGPVRIFRWRWVFLLLAVLSIATAMRQNEGANRPAAVPEQPAAATPALPVPSLDSASATRTAIFTGANIPAWQDFEVAFDYDHPDSLEESASTIPIPAGFGNSGLPGEQMSEVPGSGPAPLSEAAMVEY
jgi:hypothetical protein